MDVTERGYDDADFNWLQTGASSGSCEHDNEPLGSIKGGKFLH